MEKTTSLGFLAHSQTKLSRARWAAGAFETFDYAAVRHIVSVVAGVAHDNARRFAELTVAECGFGVVNDKEAKNRTASQGFIAEYGGRDLCSPQVDTQRRQLRFARPAGVILALTPSTSPVAALYFKVLSALLTRNAIVISPHPAVRETCVAAAELLATAAVSAGAPDGVIQVIEHPTVLLIETLMSDPTVNLILATGGGAVVSAAYRSGTPAIGVGPGNPPVLVDATADIAQAASDIVESKAFDNSVLCTAESLLLAVEPIADQLTTELVANGGYICTPDETAKVRGYMYPDGRFNTEVVGRSAADIAEAAGFRVGSRVKVLVTPIDSVVTEEPLTHEKLAPVLAMLRVPDVTRAIRAARSLLGIAGTGHSAVIHSTDPQTIFDFTNALSAHRVSVNVPGSKGNAGMGTTLPMSLSVGTGFRGGSSTGDNLTPDHLVQWSIAAFGDGADVRMPDFNQAVQHKPTAADRQMPAYPLPSDRDATIVDRAPLQPARAPLNAASLDKSELRNRLRAIISEEIRTLIGTS